MTDIQIPRLIPAPGRLVVEALEETMWGGLYLPPTAAKEKPSMGKIIGLPDCPTWEELDSASQLPNHVLGDVVVFGQNSGMQVDIGAGATRRRAIILREQDVLAKVVYDEEIPDMTATPGGLDRAQFEYASDPPVEDDPWNIRGGL